MLLAELQTEFQFGVLLVTDVSSADPIPTWASPDEQVTCTSSTLVMRVRHGDEGECIVRVWDSESEVSGGLAHTGTIELASGVLRISDALGQAAAEVSLPAGQHPIDVFADAAVEATLVNIVIGGSAAGGR